MNFSTLASITMMIVKLQFCTVALLEVLCGSWVAVLMYRKRMLCLLELCFTATRGRRAGDILHLSGDLQSELFIIACLAPLAVTNLRAKPGHVVAAVDASGWGCASCTAPVPEHVCLELMRYTSMKGGWTKLESRAATWLRKHGLDDDAIMPDEGCGLGDHPLWNDVVRSLQFEVVDIRKTEDRVHINVAEARAIFMAEAAAARLAPCTRLPIIGDSQAAGGAVAKGRSSSPLLNHELTRALPNLLGGEIYSGQAWVRSAYNVADDPTRFVAIRGPAIPEPPWLALLRSHDYAALEALVASHEASHGYDPLKPAREVIETRDDPSKLPIWHDVAVTRSPSHNRDLLRQVVTL